MAASPTDVLKAIIANPSDMKNVSALVAENATLESLNFSDPELKQIMPWCGPSRGPEGIVQAFLDVARYWDKRELEEIALFGDDRYAALFGRMTFRSTALGKQVISPFCAYIEVEDGVCVRMQFMEDTFAPTTSFRGGGGRRIQSNAHGEQVRA